MKYKLWLMTGIMVMIMPMMQAQMVTHIEDSNVKTLLIKGAGEGQYEISFDQLSHDVHLYSYRVTHLNADFTPSDLMSSEYLEGFTTADITDYDHSLNTNVNYTHYRFFFPNEEMQITKSGFYAITIYEDNDPDKVVAVATLPVSEASGIIGGKPRSVTVKGAVTSNTIREFNGRYQQLDLDLNIDPATKSDDYFIVVRQNDRLDNIVFRPQPTYRSANQLRWVNNAKLVFEGGNEYRHFDTYSTYYAGTGVDKVRYGLGDYYVTLDFDNSRTHGVYTYAFDVNGKRVINAERCEDSDYEAEYMIVHFEYPMPLHAKRSTPNLYVGGGLFYNRLTEENRMLYDIEAECFYLDALIKQGGADYQYWSVSQGPVVSLEPTEGSFWQTENEYSVYVYYRPFGSRYDELVAIEKIKSR